MYLHSLRNRTEQLTNDSLFHLILKLVEINVIFNMYPYCLNKLIFKMKMLSSNYIYLNYDNKTKEYINVFFVSKLYTLEMNCYVNY